MTTRARKTMGTGALLALAVLFIAIILVSTYLLRGARLDLTQNKLYTIAPGTERILGSLDEPVNLYFFFSDSASESVPPGRLAQLSMPRTAGSTSPIIARPVSRPE